MIMDFGTLAVLFPMLLLLLGLVFTVLIDPYIQKNNRRIMLVIAALCLVLIVQNLWENELAIGPARTLYRTIIAICGYSIRPVFLILFLYIVQPEGKRWFWWALAGINAAVYCTALFSGVCFYISRNNHYISGPLADTALYVSVILLGNLLIQTVRNFRESGKQEKWIPMIIAAMIVASVILDSQIGFKEQPIAFLTIAIVVGSVFYYIWLHLQFVREHERDLKAAQRIQIMMTQIQPHFLYNTLSTIQALCRTDPEKAFTVTEKFGIYLRQNLDSLNQTSLIPIQKELEHTRVYAEIEAVRFPHIRIDYQISDTDFSVPALTVQPLVENAIRHGVRIRHSGLVTVAARKCAACHEIIISDNGKGFDTEALEQAGEGHIGIRNVRERIETMCGGSLSVDSRIGEGTTVTIRIPLSHDNAPDRKEADP